MNFDIKLEKWRFYCAELCNLDIFSFLKMAMIELIEITRIRNQNCTTEH